MVEEAQIRELVGKMTLERDNLLNLLESLTEDDASRPPKPAEWNAKDQMSHLCEMETLYRAWVQQALQRDGANLEGVLGEQPAIPLEEAHQHSVAELISEMRQQREKTLSLIASMKPEEFDRKASNSSFGTLTVMQWLRSYYRHDRMHYDQLRGKESSYKPRFLSGHEPDQRRQARRVG